jgi:hypothetical protein
LLSLTISPLSPDAQRYLRGIKKRVFQQPAKRLIKMLCRIKYK